MDFISQAPVMQKSGAFQEQQGTAALACTRAIYAEEAAAGASTRVEQPMELGPRQPLLGKKFLEILVPEFF